MKLASVAIITMASSMTTNATEIIGTKIDLFSTPTGITRVQDSAVGPGFDPITGSPSTTFIESSDDGDGSIIGGYRDMNVNYVSGGTTGSLMSMAIDGIANTLTFNSDAGVIGTGTVQWDGGDNSSALDTTGLGGIDLYSLGRGFFYHVLQANSSFNFQTSVYDVNGNFTSFNLASAPGSHFTFLNFDLFSNAQFYGLCGGGNFDTDLGHVNAVTCSGVVDMAQIGALEIQFDTLGGTQSVGFSIASIDQYVSVPEPATLTLLSLGLFGTSFSRKKESK